MQYPANPGLWEKYVDEHAKPGTPALRNSGYPVWSIIGNMKLYRGNRKEVLKGYMGTLTEPELDAAIAYYWAYPEDIDRKLWEIAN